MNSTNLRTYLDACERLLKLDPNDADLTLALADAYLGNVHPASALGFSLLQLVLRWQMRLSEPNVLQRLFRRK
jgi:hypothetical protein